MRPLFASPNFARAKIAACLCAAAAALPTPAFSGLSETPAFRVGPREASTLGSCPYGNEMPDGHAVKRHLPQAGPEAFSTAVVLLSGLRTNAQNPNGFVVVGDALSAEPYAAVLRKNFIFTYFKIDIAPKRDALSLKAGRTLQGHGVRHPVRRRA